MAVYFTADQHLGHENIIRYCGRPFSGVADTVHVLGDIVMGRRDETMPLIAELTGRKILYPGNHDRCWYGHGPRALREEEQYLDAGFEEIRQGPVTMNVGDRDVLLCHLPYLGDSKDTERYKSFRPVDEGRWLLHGHIHEKWRQQQQMINVGVDVWDFSPVSEETLAALMT